MEQPRIASMIGLYSQVKNLGHLPEEGALLDMRPDHYAYFATFAAAEAEHIYNQNQKG